MVHGLCLEGTFSYFSNVFYNIEVFEGTAFGNIERLVGFRQGSLITPKVHDAADLDSELIWLSKKMWLCNKAIQFPRKCVLRIWITFYGIRN